VAPFVAVVVLKWNGLEDTAECLASVDELSYPDLLRIVVDNGSADGSVDELAVRFPDWILLRNPRNLGYARGNNVGMRRALAEGADYVMLLNNDARIDREAVTRLVEVAENEPSTGVLGARIYHWDQPDLIWCDGGTVDPVTVEPHHEGLLQRDADRATDVVETEYVSGCALIARASVLREVGLLDEDYFLVFEEADFCARVRQRGFRAVVVPGAKVWHKVSVSFGGGESQTYLYYFHRNNLLYVHKRLRGFQRLRGYFFVLKRQAHYVWYLYRNGKPEAGQHRRVMSRAIGDFVLGRWGDADLSGLSR
jgi:GT2 family glycosyltransferase